MAVEDELEGRSIGAVILAVLGVPMAAEGRIRHSVAAGVRAASGPGPKAVRAVTGFLAWLAYVPVIALYQAFAVPLVVGSVVLTAALVALAYAVGWPPAFVFGRVVGRARCR